VTVPLVLGIDEAGYGPLLGPLVIGATLWRCALRPADADLWQHLDTAVTRAAGRRDSRLVVDDSKRVFDRGRGPASLERTVLVFADAAGVPHGTLGEFITALAGVPLGSVCPWYADLGRRLPVAAAPDAHAGATARLVATMTAARAACVALRAEVLPEDLYNRRVAATRNKAAVLLESVLRLVHWAGGRAARQDLYVVVDRLGGRADYRGVLMAAFPERHLHVVAQEEGRSAYRLADATSDWHLEFVVDGDQKHLPIALASMLAKYVRELLMHELNAFWRGLVPGVRPTAGYYTDAQRFLADIRPGLARAAVAVSEFVRGR